MPNEAETISGQSAAAVSVIDSALVRAESSALAGIRNIDVDLSTHRRARQKGVA